MAAIVNIAAYKFVPLSDLSQRRQDLRAVCRQQDLKGTILLSTEGINLFVAGPAPGIGVLLERLRSDEQLADLSVKESLSEFQPFTRMLVKIKREIISFGLPHVSPTVAETPRLAPATLQQWLDSQQTVRLLDVRNDYETQLGTFAGAHTLGISHFREFPRAAERLPDSWRETPLVLFCTGGIRCEKAGPFLQQQGFRHVWQLDGGILKYFEECGGRHFHGECFVFDQRVALNSQLNSTATQCFACRAPLLPCDLLDPRYQFGVSCAACYQTADELQVRLRDQRHARLREVTSPLPGSKPYTNRRPIYVTRRWHGETALTFLSQRIGALDRANWEQRLITGMVLRGDQPIGPEAIVHTGDRLDDCQPDTVEPAVATEIQIVYEDPAILVVDKPAPLPLHPCGRYHRNTLLYILKLVYPCEKLRAAHRLDANTSGLVVFARSRAIASLVQPQFERGEVQKVYFARVMGHPDRDRWTMDDPIDPRPRAAGARAVESHGQPAVTQVSVWRREPDGTSIVWLRPLTGRTNQIRIHLWYAGFPIVGDPMYGAQRQLFPRQTLATDEPPLHLHAARLSLLHPRTGQRMEWRSAPTWLPDLRHHLDLEPVEF